jgi:rubrerythrin
MEVPLPLSREEIEQIAKSSAQTVLEGLHRYAVDYKEPETIEQGLQDSMIEESTAIDWYRKRAKHASSLQDPKTASVYLHIADDEADHLVDFKARLQGLAKQGSPVIQKFLALPEEQVLKIPDEVVNALKVKGFQDEYIRTKMSIREMKGALSEGTPAGA